MIPAVGMTGCKEEQPETTQPGAAEEQLPRAPDFTVYDRDGNPVRLSDFAGTPVVLNFWASWCGPSKKEMPDFDEVCAQMGDKVQFMMINLTDGTMETMDSATAFLDDQPYKFPVFFDTGSEAAAAYGIASIPTTYLINTQGQVVGRAKGAIDGKTLQQGIDMLLP